MAHLRRYEFVRYCFNISVYYAVQTPIPLRSKDLITPLPAVPTFACKYARMGNA